MDEEMQVSDLLKPYRDQISELEKMDTIKTAQIETLSLAFIALKQKLLEHKKKQEEEDKKMLQQQTKDNKNLKLKKK